MNQEAMKKELIILRTETNQVENKDLKGLKEKKRKEVKKTTN